MEKTVTYRFNEHLITKQAEAEKQMIKELEEGNYTYDKPLVKYNAYLINPLSAVILFETELETAVTVTVCGKKPEGNLVHTFPPAKRHILPIVGLYNDYENRVELRLYRGKSATVLISVPDVFNGRKMALSMDTTHEYLQDQFILLSPASENYATGFDYAGEPRFHLSVPCIFDLKRAKNGNILIGTDRLLRTPYYTSGVYEMSLVGKIYKEFRLPGGYHHDQWEMPDGNLLILTEDLNSETTEDMCVLVDRETGDILKTWDFKDFLVPGMGKSGSWSDEDWFHNNAVWYDEKTNSITLSGRHMDIMVNIDFDTSKINWIIGDPEGWPQDWVDRYFLKPVGDDFEWQYEQHACLITPDGDVMCFDNHHLGSKDPEKYLPAKKSYSRGVRYRLNLEERTIEQIWQYGKERGFEFYSPYISNVEYYNEGHYMVHSGGIAYMNGEPSEVIGGFARTMGGDLYSTTVEVCDGRVMLELKTPGNYYRAEKLKMYSGQDLELGEGKILGSMCVTEEFDTEIPAEACGEMLPASCAAVFEEEEDRFTLRSTFEKGQLVMLLLERGEEVHRYFISTSVSKSRKAMCCGTFLESDERITKTSVNKKGLSGTYEVRIIIDDKKYETGVTITCREE